MYAHSKHDIVSSLAFSFSSLLNIHFLYDIDSVNDDPVLPTISMVFQGGGNFSIVSPLVGIPNVNVRIISKTFDDTYKCITYTCIHINMISIEGVLISCIYTYKYNTHLF